MTRNPNVTDVLELFKAEVNKPLHAENRFFWQLYDPYRIIGGTAPANEFGVNEWHLRLFLQCLNRPEGKEHYEEQKASIIPLVERLLYKPTLPAIQTIARYVWDQLPEADRLVFFKGAPPESCLEGP